MACIHWITLVVLRNAECRRQAFLYSCLENHFSSYGCGIAGGNTNHNSFLARAVIQKNQKLDNCRRDGYNTCNLIYSHMGGWIVYNKALQKTHLIASMIILSYMLMYVISGIILINRDLFTIPPVEEKHSRIPVEKPMTGDQKQYSKYLKQSLNLKGRVECSTNDAGDWIFYFNYPGDNYQLTLTPNQDTLYIRHSTQKMNLITVTQRIHMMRGFKGGWEYAAWAVMYDASCFAMIVFAVTGVLIWFRKRKAFRYGWWYLAAGILIPALVISAFLLWK